MTISGFSMEKEIEPKKDLYQEYIGCPVGIYIDRIPSFGIYRCFDIERKEITLQPSITYCCQKPRLEEDLPKKIRVGNVNLMIIEPLKEGDLEKIIEYGLKTEEIGTKE